MDFDFRPAFYAAITIALIVGLIPGIGIGYLIWGWH